MQEAQIKRGWDMLSKVPGGKHVYSRLLGLMAPYTRTIGARVEELRPGYARVVMRDRWAVRNHLRSVHAVALMNLGELTGNLALMAGMPEDARTIVTGFRIEYLKKLRGGVTAECTVEPPATSERQRGESHVDLMNPEGEVCARATLEWLVGPR